MKKLIIGIIIGGIIFGSIGVLGATYLYQAKDVSYNDTNVESAIYDLYEMAGNFEFDENITIFNSLYKGGSGYAYFRMITEITGFKAWQDGVGGGNQTSPNILFSNMTGALSVTFLKAGTIYYTSVSAASDSNFYIEKVTANQTKNFNANNVLGLFIADE